MTTRRHEIAAPSDLPTSDEGDQVHALVDSVVGSTPLNKRPLLIADDLEEQFVRRGWPVGMSFGGEATLASQYNVGRDVLREVVRLLEGRNHAKMRRGPRGGLEVVLPGLEGLVGRLAGYAYVSNLDDGEIVDTWLILQRVAVQMLEREAGYDWRRLASGLLLQIDGGFTAIGTSLIEAADSPLLAILGQILAALLPSLPLEASSEACMRLSRTNDAEELLSSLDAIRTATVVAGLLKPVADAGIVPTSMPLDSPAMQLVHSLMSNTAPREWVRGHLIGNEFDLADRFGVDKSVVRQAIRLMEDAEAARAIPGRGHGLVTQMPSTAPLSRLLSAYLVAHQLSVEDGERVFAALRIESAGLAADRATVEDHAALLAMCHDLEALEAPCPVSALQGFERLQQRATHNRLLGMFIDGIKAFLTWRTASWPVASPQIIKVYRAHTKLVVTAICSGNRAAAMAAEASKLDALSDARAQ